MADIELVIRIPEEDYKDCIKYDALKSSIYKAIQNGTPLPKRHGRLIDADAFIATMEDVSKRQKYKELLINKSLTVDDVFKAIIGSLQNKGLAEGDSPTIIEADKEDKKPTCEDCKEWGTVNCTETYREPTKKDNTCESFLKKKMER